MAQPNDWSKQVHAGSTDTVARGKRLAYSEFWSNLLDRIRIEQPGWTSSTLRPRATRKHSAADSVRLHIPRAIRVVYGIRNKRDAAHLNDGIDPNVQDSSLIASMCDWILAELVRLHHGVPAAEAAPLVEDIVRRKAPSVQDFDGHLKILDPTLAAGDHVLLLLYQCGRHGAIYAELACWSRLT